MEWPTPNPVTVMEKGVARVKQPWPIDKKIRAILRDVEKKNANPRDRWMGIKRTEGRGIVENVLGPMIEGDLSDIDRVDAIWYSARDADATLRLYPHLWRRVVDSGLELTFWRDMGAMQLVVRMMQTGIKIDKDHFATLSKYLQSNMDQEQEECQAAMISAGVKLPTGVKVNPDSPAVIAPILYGQLKLNRILPGNSTEDSMLVRALSDNRVSEKVKDVITHTRNYRTYSKLKTSYSDPMPDRADHNDRVHSTFRITRTATGRLSSSEPNLMAQPVRSSEGRKIRDGFIAENGCFLVSCDYSQIEMRVICHDSHDAAMTRIFRDGLDIHSQTASSMFGIKVEDLDEMKHRYPAKRVGFGVLNDLSPEGLQREMVAGGASLSDWPVDRCAELIREWFRVYSGVDKFMESTRNHAKRFGWVQDMHGRRRSIPHARSMNRSLREEALRQAGNAPIQMGAQGIIKQAMWDLVAVVDRWVQGGNTWNPLIQIHDDLVCEMGSLNEDPDTLDLMIIEKVHTMENAVSLSVPVRVDTKYGKRWGSMEKWKH
jgi:DNA polymerase-1